MPRRGTRCVQGWVNPGDFVAVAVKAADGKARLYQRKDDGPLATLSTSGTALNLTTNNWYTLKVVVDVPDPNAPAAQRLRCWDAVWHGPLANGVRDL